MKLGLIVLFLFLAACSSKKVMTDQDLQKELDTAPDICDYDADTNSCADWGMVVKLKEVSKQ
jgi:hypothetical protein